MPFIQGTDDQGKIHWLTQDAYWGSRAEAFNFSPLAAKANLTYIRQRNLYLTPEDIIWPKLVEEISHES